VGSWKAHTAALKRYARREPEKSALYHIVSSCREELAYVWEEEFQQRFGALRDEVTEALDAYLSCGILAHGCARAHCEQCKHSALIAFSCKRRCLCPSCNAKRSLLFAEKLVANTLTPYLHQHCVFTVPKRVRAYFKFDRKLLGLLYSAAWDAWKELMALQHPTGSPAAVLALHTAGDLLTFHPHIHGLFLAGAIEPEGSFVPVAIDKHKLQECFARNVLQALLQKQLLSPEDVDNILGWPHSGFNVFIGDPILPSDADRLLFVARYLKKCPVSNERIRILEQNGSTTIRYLSFKNGDKSSRDFEPLEFLAELSQHIPDTWEQTTRFLGAYSSRTRGAQKAQVERSQILPLPEPAFKPSPTWARLIKMIFEIDPLACPRCGAQMKIKAFVTNPAEIHRLSVHLGLPTQNSPPKLRFHVPLAA
jgi:hypothetical protein